MKASNKKLLENVNTFVLDFDGTLIDSVKFIENTFASFFKTQNIQVENGDFKKVITLPISVIFKQLAPDRDFQFLAGKLNEHQKPLEHTVFAIPGTVEILQKVKKRGGKIVILTARQKSSALPLLKQTGIFEYMDFGIFPEDITHHKPHPEGILKALVYFGEKPENAVMVGDALVDIQAGKAAEVKTVAVLTGFDKKKIHTANPDIILPTISHIHKHL